MKLLSVRNLSVTIRGIPILSELSFDMAPGRVFGLLGESGSGKSMTALALMGLLPHGARRTGSALFQGQDLLRMAEAGLFRLRGNRIGMIFQEPMTALNPLVTIGDQVAETVRLHENLSRLIVLDEPVSALDLRVQAQVLDLLARLRMDHGLAYLFISHDLSVVRRITDRVLIMQAGRIVEHGPTAQVFDAPQKDYTRRLIAAAPRIPVAWKETDA